MKRNCNVNLHSVPTSNSKSGGNPKSVDDLWNASQQQVTIFYNGEVCACDVTEFQARARIWLASKEMKDGLNNPPVSSQSTLHGTSCLSMRKSLQMFLQKRKHRIQAAFPNNNSCKHK